MSDNVTPIRKTSKSKAKEATQEETPQEQAPEEAQEVLDQEVERLVPGVGEPLVLLDGTLVMVRPLKLKELFSAIRIITRGAAMSVGAIDFSALPPDQIAETMVALLINAFPEADAEFCEFLRIVVDPAEDPRDAESNAHLDELLLDNPDLEDAIDILTAVFYRESQDLHRLGKKIANAVQVMTKVTPKIKS